MPVRPPLTPEILVPRLGDYLVERGLLTNEDLKTALNRQKNLRAEGKVLLLGQVLVDLHLIDRTTLDRAITEVILQLRSALQDTNHQLQDTNQQLEQRVEERTEELEQALRKLSELNKLKANFVANVSHELRTPLTHIMGYLELFLSDSLGALTDEQRLSLEVMHHSSQRLEQLIEDLILFSTSEREQFNLQVAPFDIGEICQNVLARSKEKADERKHSLLFEISPNMPRVLGDSDKIAWVILQLLDNAIKFTPNAGRIMLKITHLDNLVKVAVIDTGIGIETSRMDEAFEPFHQLDGSSTRRFGGTGLGLTLVKKIIEAHGSTIIIESEVGQGSCFSFLLKAIE